jgi:CRP-like cAMP-binding protein
MKSNLVDFLRSVPILSGLDEEVLEILANACHLKRVSKGQYLFFQGDQGDAAYLVHHGTIAIQLSTPDGRELVINEMHPGECFGELALLLEEPRSASALAREDCQVVWIPRSEFLAQVDAEPKLMRTLLQTIASRLVNSGERESALAFLDAPARIAQFLIQRAAEEVDHDDLVTLSQEELAQHIGVTRQTVAKSLGDWRRNGWIITGRGKIMLVDMDALQSLAEENMM